MATVDLAISVAGIILASMQLIEARTALADQREFQERVLSYMDSKEKLLELKEARQKEGDVLGVYNINALAQEYRNPILEGYLKSEAFYKSVRDKFDQEESK